MPRPNAFIRSVTFSDGTQIDVARTDIVVIVGANNVGKSVALKEIHEKALLKSHATTVVRDVSVEVDGSPEDLDAWLERTCRKRNNPSEPNNPSYSRLRTTVSSRGAKRSWQNASTHGLDQLGRLFIYRLTTDARLQAANPATNIQITREPLTHPIHYMQVDDSIEEKISKIFHQAFGEEIIVHRNAGNQVPLYCGTRPELGEDEDRVSPTYIRRLESLPTLQSQGDGMRAFVGVLLHAFIVEHSAVLIDEPEAFLHPPQARFLGRLLVEQAPKDRQLFVATHSGDVLRGLLDADSKRVRILRIQRNGNVNPIAELDNAGIRRLWNDPLLRYSNVLDGVFHSGVVVCESDSDCRFYAAIRDAITEGGGGTPGDDSMFVHAGGKDRMAVVIRSLRNLKVPVSAVADFDVLNTRTTVQRLWEGLGGQWDRVQGDWELVRDSIESKKPELETEEVRREIDEVLQAVKESHFPKNASKRIQQILRRSSPWATAKGVGKRFVPSGDPTQACDRLFDTLKSQGLFVVDVGELEGWCRSVGSHGPAWVNAVLEKNLLEDRELAPACEFVKGLLPSRALNE